MIDKRIKSTLILATTVVIFVGGAVFIKYNKAQQQNVGVNSKAEEVDKTSKKDVDIISQNTNKAEEKKTEETKNEDKNKSDNKNNENSEINKTNGNLTTENATEILKKYIDNKYPNLKCIYDHNQEKDGVNYYVFRVYQAMPDHTATIGWYFVNTNTGKIFEWDLIDDKLMPID